jgi:hypothetical protein
VLTILLHSPLAASAEPPDDKPRVVVALGDGLVVAPGGKDAVSAGLAAGLGDCLEEKAPKRWGVVDRSDAGETLVSARPKVGDVVGLGPAWVVVALGARELADPATDPEKLAAELGAFALSVRGDKPESGRTVLLLGALASAGEGDRAPQQARVDGFNEALAKLGLPGVVHLDPAKVRKVPKDGLVDGEALTAAGQAKVVAAICELVLTR